MTEDYNEFAEIIKKWGFNLSKVYFPPKNDIKQWEKKNPVIKKTKEYDPYYFSSEIKNISYVEANLFEAGGELYGEY